MNYQIIKPSTRLQPYIEGFWLQENLENFPDCRPTTVLPTTTIDLIFIYNDPFIQINSGQSELLPLSYVSGQKTKSIQVAATGRTGMIVVRFYPWGAAPFFRFPIEELTDASIDLRLLADDRAVKALEQHLREGSTAAERLNRIESFLLHLLNTKRCDSLVVESVYRINRAMGNLSITDLARQLDISRRQFHRRFTRVVGTSPKEFAGIVRFQKSLYRTKSGAGWPEIVLDCGFYDQAHLIREMKKYSGFSHQKVLSANPSTSLMNHFNADRKMTHLYNTTYL